MSRMITVGVSAATAAEFSSAPRTWMRFHVVGAGTKGLEVIWRRQADRTAWLLSALDSCPSVRWVHTDTAGIDHLPLHVFMERRITLSNARGVHSTAVSEWALGALIMAARRLDEVVRASDGRRWAYREPCIELSGRSVFILGTGSIGRALAKGCSALGMRVVGVARTAGSRGSVSYVDRQLTITEDWAGELGQSSFLVICLPLTPATRGLVNRTVLEGLPEHAWVINVGRGEIVDERALVAAVASSRIGGAVLDTISHEPPQSDDPLWGHPNIIISPHVSSFTDQTSERTQSFFLAEADRYRKGLAPTNEIDPERGY